MRINGFLIGILITSTQLLFGRLFPSTYPAKVHLHNNFIGIENQ